MDTKHMTNAQFDAILQAIIEIIKSSDNKDEMIAKIEKLKTRN